jgi:hypothetical protein
VRRFSTYLVLICALALVVTAAGCGDDDSDGSREDEIEEITAKTAALEDTVEADDVEAFCNELAPSFIEEAGGIDACLKQFNPKRAFFFNIPEGHPRADQSVKTVEFEGETSATAYLNNKGFLYFVKEDGEWYPTFPTQ